MCRGMGRETQHEGDCLIYIYVGICFCVYVFTHCLCLEKIRKLMKSWLVGGMTKGGMDFCGSHIYYIVKGEQWSELIIINFFWSQESEIFPTGTWQFLIVKLNIFWFFIFTNILMVFNFLLHKRFNEFVLPPSLLKCTTFKYSYQFVLKEQTC